MPRTIFRRLLQAPGFTSAILLTLAIGIGANTAIFSVLNGILLKPLPYPESDRLIGLWHSTKSLKLEEASVCPSMYFVYREQNRSFEDVGTYSSGSVSVTQTEQPEQVHSLFVTQGVLPLLRIKLLMGRLFTSADDTDGNPATVLISSNYWHKHFSSSAGVLRHHLVVDGRPREIVGVLPSHFWQMDPQPDLVFPQQFNRSKVFLGDFSFNGIARLKPGVTLAEANADLARLIPIWLKSFPPFPGIDADFFRDLGLRPKVHPFMSDIIGNIASVVWILMGTVSAVLLIACANVANLLLVRAEGRQHELSIRAALGASRGRLARELLAESLSFALAGGILGLAFAWAALRLLVALAPTGLPRLFEISLDPSALLFTLLISVLAGALFGILPVWKYAGPNPGTGLRESSRSVSGGRERHRARNLLVVVEVALALVLLISSGLMIRTFQALRHVDPGFVHPEQLQTVRLSIPETQIKQPEAVARWQNLVMTRLAALPGVASVALTSSMTMDGHMSSDVLLIQEQLLAAGRVPPVRRFKFISPGFFTTVGRRLIAGRDLTWTDIYGYRPVALLSENVAREYWPNPAEAIGKHVREGTKDDWREVIGVVANEHDDGLDKPASSVAYFPFLTKRFWNIDVFALRDFTLVLRTPQAGSVAFLSELRQTIWSLNNNLPLFEIKTVGEIYAASTARTSFTLVLLAVAACMALVLGVIGIYGVISYSVSQRRREIGIRMALGARQEQVSGMFLRHGLGLTLIGIFCGLAASLAVTRLLSSLLFSVKPIDPLTYGIVSLGLLGAALLASYVPARRAITVDPVEALRAE